MNQLIIKNCGDSRYREFHPVFGNLEFELLKEYEVSQEIYSYLKSENPTGKHYDFQIVRSKGSLTRSLIKKDQEVNVLIPVADSYIEFLEECLLSIADQTYKNIRVVIFFDGISEENKKIVKQILDRYKQSFKIRYHIADKNLGVIVARRELLKMVRKIDSNSICVWHDADDIMHEKKIEQLLCCYNEVKVDDDHKLVVGCNQEKFSYINQIEGKRASDVVNYDFQSELKTMGYIMFDLPSFTVREHPIKDKVVFREDLQFYKDMITGGYCYYHVPYTLHFYRQHNNSITSKLKELGE